MAIKKKAAVRKKKTVAKKPKRQLVKRTRNGGTWTESEFFSRIRASLRNMSRWWKPIQLAKQLSRRKCAKKGKQIWEYQCVKCNNYFPDKTVSVHHIIEVGSLRCSDDLKGFVERLFAEDLSHYAVLCTTCHKNEHTEKTIII